MNVARLLAPLDSPAIATRVRERADGVGLAATNPATAIPTVDEAEAKLALLAGRGPSADAFRFREPFPPLRSRAR